MPLAPEEVDRVGAVLGLHRLERGDGYLALTDPPELQDVSVRPEHRHRGIASALTLAAEQETSAHRFDRLTLTVSINNEPAQTLYKTLGFVDAGIPPNGCRAQPSYVPAQSKSTTRS
jgi:ribosomal protein S18 acetylase RimI-like enzyme